MTLRHRTGGLIFVMIALLSFNQRSNAQINVISSQTALALAQKLAGPGVTISNATLTCPSESNGIFTVVASSLGLDSGIVLTNGRAATDGGGIGVNGPSSDFASTDNGAGGDAQLNILAGEATTNACALQFDMMPRGDTVRFSYVFSSEEYKNAVCASYNDAFGFFISGPGISSYDNMALVPGTNIPVTINTINNGIVGTIGTYTNCTTAGAGSPFTAYYIDNSAGTTLTHLGFTRVLQAIHGVSPCGVYHLKLVIADGGDPLFDSGVFLEAGSLQTENYSVSALIPVAADTSSFCVKGCLPGVFRIKRSQAVTSPQTIKFITAGSAVSGVDYAPLADSVVIPAGDTVAEVTVTGLATPPAGTRTLQLFIMSPFPCAGISNIVDSASMLIYDTLHIAVSTPDTIVCARDSVHLRVTGNSFLSYSWSPAAGLTNSNIMDPVAFPSFNTAYVVTGSIPGTACMTNAAAVTFTTKLTPDILLSADTSVCYNTSFTLNGEATPANPFYTYQWTGPDGFTAAAQYAAINNAAAQNSGRYTVTALNDTNGCKGTASINLTVNVPDTPGFASPYIICLNTEPTALTANGQNLLWYSDTGTVASASAPVIPTDQPASFTYFVTQTVDNCESPKEAVGIVVEKCCNGTISIPSGFTPNGDGLNERFQPLTAYGYFIKSMSVFNRWGQEVYTGTDQGWDGRYGAAAAETGTYFYHIVFGCILGGTVDKRGDVTLIR